MILLSNIFRSFNTVSEQGETKKIGIRSLKLPTDSEPTNNLSLDVIYAERDRILEQANGTIEHNKSEIEQMRQTANEDIAAMHTAWENEKTILQQQAYEEGFQIGHEEGRSKVLAEMADTIKLTNDTTTLSNENAKHHLANQERVILDLGIRTAERIIGKTLEDDEEIYISIVRRALKEAREMKEVRLYVSIDYFKLISDNRQELASIFPPDVPFLVFANDDFASTQCYIETNHGRIVVSIDDQLNELKERLVEIMESGD